MDEQFIIKNAVESARKWLPDQAPISKFVHHNTLHSFEDMPFEDAVEFVSSIRKTNSYKPHMEYLQDYKNKRISAEDIDFVVAEFCQKSIDKNNGKINLKSLTISDFYRSLLMVPESSETDASLLWLAEEGLKKYFYEFSSYSTKNRFISKTKEVIDKIIEKEDMKTIIQYLTCNATAEGQRACFFDEYQVRGSDGLLALYSTSIEEFSLKFLWIALQQKICWKYRKNRSSKYSNNSLNGYSKVADEKLRDSLDQLMIRLMAAFLDDGLSFWPMPDRDQGFLSVFLKLAEFGDRFLPDFAKWFPDELKVSIYENKSNYEIINDILFSFDIPKNNWNEYICRELLFLSGWSGTASLIEKKPELMHNFSIKSELADVLAVRLILKKNLLEHQYKSNFTNDQENYSKSDFVSTMLQVFRFMQVAGISACEVVEMSQEEFNALMTRILGFNDVARRRLLHLSYERHYYREILDSVAINQKCNREFDSSKECKIQAVFCIDDREESFRRHLEEISENIETYAVAGFYNIDMYYQSVDADKPSPLCPGSMTPKYKVIEKLSEGSKEKNDRLVKQMQHSLYHGSKKVVLGHITSLIGGYLTILPLIFRVLAPRVAKRFLANLGKIANASQKTELLIERSQYEPDLSEEILKLGYTVNEMVDRVHSILCAIGLVKDFSPLVFIIGHGSNSYNNPHESAHDCGACGGQRGGPNARVFAMMANRSDVREKLERLGINISNSVLFVGGYHDTCSDEITLFDLDSVPNEFVEKIRDARAVFDKATCLDAHERCRRFDDVRGYSPEKAIFHVEGRAHNLREPRPEYGHATNSICIVGKRSLTKGLFLDRRSFLVSYDAELDTDGSILSGLLEAVIPVCAGINLEYYFSFVDNTDYGCGTKLPHNITGLIGVMDGYSSDLRTGLPWQMVEIHEPVRLLFLIQSSRSRFEQIMGINISIERYVKNNWIRIAVIEPDSDEIFLYEQEGFVRHEPSLEDLLRFSCSKNYYDGKSEHLSPVRIDGVV